MVKYAHYTPGESPAYVNGWYNSETYPADKMPPAAELLELTEKEWGYRYDQTTHWKVENNRLVPSPHRPAPVGPAPG